MLDEPNGVVAAETDARQGILLNIMVGSVEALLAGLRRAPLFGVGPIHQHDFRLASRCFSRLGAMSLLRSSTWPAAAPCVERGLASGASSRRAG
jgi:uncharacterized membrane protein YeaQ/YmgE (transglycosylase-associated protein family)